jgi:AhpD family alkylhydroperoxidase
MSTKTYATTEDRRDAVRVPLEEPTTLFDKTIAWYCRKTYGQVLDNALALMHNRKVLKALFGFEKKVAKWDALDPDLKVLAQAVSASVIGCSWCMDFGYYAAHSQGLDTSKLGEIPFWRESDAFTPQERRVLEYAEAMTVTPPEVTDEMAEALRPLHGADKVARWLVGVGAKTPISDARWVVANGNVSVLLYVDGELDSVGTVYAVDGKITEIYLVRNPDKLTGIGVPREIRAR